MTKKSIYIIGIILTIFMILHAYASFWYECGKTADGFFKFSDFGGFVFLMLYSVALFIIDVVLVKSFHQTKKQSIFATVANGIFVMICLLPGFFSTGITNIGSFISFVTPLVLSFILHFLTIFMNES